MSKTIIVLGLILILGFTIYQTRDKLLERGLLIFEELKEQIIPEEEKGGLSEEETIPEEEFILSDRAEKFYISSGKIFPIFTKEVTADPFKVKGGEEQTFSIWAKDSQGIEEVIAKIATDAEEELIELELIEGTDREGRWIGSWITRNISAKSTYSTSFLATNKMGEQTQMSLFWQVEKEKE